MGTFYTEKNTHVETLPNGKTKTSTDEVVKEISKSNEPDYIKLYTNVWCEFKSVPVTYRNLFLELAMRMTYAKGNKIDDKGKTVKNTASGQLVNTGKPYMDEICSILGWKKSMYHKGLNALCDCNAIRRVNRGVYQINPSFAGKGAWHYNAKTDNGGVKDLIATFNFVTGSVETDLSWEDEDEGSEDD